MHSWIKMALITLGWAGWPLLAGCQGLVVGKGEKQARIEPGRDSPAEDVAPDAADGGRIAVADLRDVRQLAEAATGGGLSLADARRWVRPEMVPQLLDMLADPTYAENWGGIAELLALGPPDSRSLAAIMDFITRQDDWRDLPRRTLDIRVGTKIHAARWIGWVGGPEATAFLRKVVESTDGAESALLWFDNERSPEIHGGSQDTTRVIFANAAAVGLIYTRDPENIAIVRDRHERSGAFRMAMVVNRIIEERGLDWYSQNYPTGSEYAALQSRYLRETYADKPQPRLGRYSTEAKEHAETGHNAIR